jgi:hypothetical protein
MRKTGVIRDCIAGCFVCGGNKAMWKGPNAQGVAARHHDATCHETWCAVTLSIRYGWELSSTKDGDDG